MGDDAKDQDCIRPCDIAVLLLVDACIMSDAALNNSNVGNILSVICHKNVVEIAYAIQAGAYYWQGYNCRKEAMIL